MSNESTDNPIVFSVDSNPHGQSYAEWTAKWWIWALSIPLENNPIKDDMNRYYKLNQSGPVWFLAGTGQGTVHKRCTISRDKAILAPILNYGATLADEPTVRSEEELVSLAKREMDEISNLNVTVDKRELTGLQRFRVRSPVFDIVLPQNSLFGGTPGPTRGVADGYWLFLKPMNIGIHTIESFGSCQAGRVMIGARYEVTISE
jgi:hypothetical protein